MLLERGAACSIKQGKTALVVHVGGKQPDMGCYSGIVVKKVNIIQHVGTKCSLGAWEAGFDLIFIKSGKATMRILHETVILFKIIVKNWNRDRRE